jgi:hypothetical protein
MLVGPGHTILTAPPLTTSNLLLQQGPPHRPFFWPPLRVLQSNELCGSALEIYRKNENEREIPVLEQARLGAEERRQIGRAEASPTGVAMPPDGRRIRGR